MTKEETEVKTKREIIENIDGEMNYVKEKLPKMDREKSEGRKEWHEGYLVAMKEARNKVSQLEEPETLTPEWIDERIHYSTDQDAFGNIVRIESVPVKFLQNLLVPKQEEVTHKQVEKYLLDRNIRVIDIDVYEKMQSNLAEFENKIVIEKPVIPKFVADWIEKYVEYGYDLYPALKKMENNARSWERTYDWYRNNTLEFVLAYLTQEYEIEVEEEQKYYVLFGNQPHDDNWTYALTNSGSIEIFEKDVLPEWDRTKLTEQEIKDYDERFWAFRKPVEELEE